MRNNLRHHQKKTTCLGRLISCSSLDSNKSPTKINKSLIRNRKLVTDVYGKRGEHVTYDKREKTWVLSIMPNRPVTDQW